MAAPVSITIELDREEYSRFEEDRAVINMAITLVGTAGQDMSSEQFVVSLYKARRNRDYRVYYETITNTSTSNPAEFSFDIDLRLLRDSEDIPVIRRGKYFIRVESVTDDTVYTDSDDFYLSLISVDGLKDSFLFGTDLTYSDRMDPYWQPRDITGVTIKEVGSGHRRGSFYLRYLYNRGSLLDGTANSGCSGTTINLKTGGTMVVNAYANKYLKYGTEERKILSNTASAFILYQAFSSDPSEDEVIEVLPTDAIRQLVWAKGQIVTLSRTKTEYICFGLDGKHIVVKVDWASLPDENLVEQLLIDKKKISDTVLRKLIDQACDQWEDMKPHIYAEPTRIITDLTSGSALPGEGSEYYISEANWDIKVQPISYQRAPDGQWINLLFPWKPLVKFENLDGRFMNNSIFEMSTGNVHWSDVGGLIQCVPYQEYGYSFSISMSNLLMRLNNTDSMPNFWHFTAIVGYRDCPDVVMQIISMMAAINILTLAGQGFMGGIASRGISRDGVSENISTTASPMYGTYSATINQFEKKIKELMPIARDRWRGSTILIC